MVCCCHFWFLCQLNMIVVVFYQVAIPRSKKARSKKDNTLSAFQGLYIFMIWVRWSLSFYGWNVLQKHKDFESCSFFEARDDELGSGSFGLWLALAESVPIIAFRILSRISCRLALLTVNQKSPGEQAWPDRPQVDQVGEAQPVVRNWHSWFQ